MSGDVNYSDMVAALAKDGDIIAGELTGNEAHNLHMVVGISGEAGELLKPFLEIEHGVASVLDRLNIIEELGDLEFYMEGLRQGLNIHRDVILSVPMDTMPSVLLTEFIAASTISLHASELLDSVKKATIYRKPLDLANVVEQFSILEYYIEYLRNLLGISREETLDANIVKLSVRYEGLKYSDESAQNRADKGRGE